MDADPTKIRFTYSPTADKKTDDIFYYYADLEKGPDFEGLKSCADELGCPEQHTQIAWLMQNVYNMFLAQKCNMIEINNLVVDDLGYLFA